MDILGIGPLEALFIALIALLVIGPKDIGRTARALGRFLNQLYRSDAWRTLNEASRNLRTLPNRLAREAALEELDSARKELQEAGRQIGKDVEDAGKQAQAAGKELESGLKAWTPKRAESSEPEPDAPTPESTGESPAGEESQED
jgi:sec-independent protein translocase protein TatB